MVVLEGEQERMSGNFVDGHSIFPGYHNTMNNLAFPLCIVFLSHVSFRIGSIRKHFKTPLCLRVTSKNVCSVS